MDGDTGHGEGFDLRQARLPDFYPTDDVLAEMGRVARAAARVDSRLALLLLAVKYPEPENPESLDVLRKWPTSRLAEQAQRILKRRFEGHMLDVALAAVDCAAERQDKRHVVLHSLWTPETPRHVVQGGHPRRTGVSGRAGRACAGARASSEIHDASSPRGRSRPAGDSRAGSDSR